MIVDVNNDWLPEGLYDDEALLREIMRIPPRSQDLYTYIGKVPRSDEEQIIIEQPKGYSNLNYTRANVDVERRIQVMDEIGVDKAFLRIPCLGEWMDLDTCRRMNDLRYQTVQKHPDRFVPVAVCPPWGDKDMLKELERCVKELGCVGVEMASHYGDKHVDEPEFRAYLRKINELGVPIIMRNSPLPAAYKDLYQYEKTRRTLGRSFSLLTAITRLIFSDVFDELPDLKFVFSFLGGGFFAFTDMMNVRPSGKYKEEMARVHDPKMGQRFEEILKNNLYFDMNHATPWGKTLEFAIKALGADHVLYGSSYPIKLEWAYEGPNFVRSLNISEEDKALILGGNAARLFKLS